MTLSSSTIWIIIFPTIECTRLLADWIIVGKQIIESPSALNFAKESFSVEYQAKHLNN